MTSDFSNFTNEIVALGEAKINSPLKISKFIADRTMEIFLTDYEKVMEFVKEGKDIPSFERAGPREKIYFDPFRTKAAIVTCGGLCPGLNDVIRSIVMSLYYHYGVRKILGIKHGYNGIVADPSESYVPLTPELVTNIHHIGGTILGTSRGAPEVERIVDVLEYQNVNILFTIGGDGTNRGAHEIAKICLERKNGISVVGIPKTIDNDISYISRTFGFLTAVEEGRRCLTSIHNEAKSLPYGVGIMKIMGRDSGFIAANVCLSNNDANYCLVPEVDFDFDGEKGLLADVEKRVRERAHAVIVVAEGAGQKFFEKNKVSYDASGNVKLNDIGLLLVEKIKAHFKEKDLPTNVKYVDPSYIVRSQAANAEDSAFCLMLGQHAVHAAMTGKTDVLISSWNNVFIHVPIALSIAARKKINPNGVFWHSVVEATGQSPLTN